MVELLSLIMFTHVSVYPEQTYWLRGSSCIFKNHNSPFFGLHQWHINRRLFVLIKNMQSKLTLLFTPNAVKCIVYERLLCSHVASSIIWDLWWCCILRQIIFNTLCSLRPGSDTSCYDTVLLFSSKQVLLSLIFGPLHSIDRFQRLSWSRSKYSSCSPCSLLALLVYRCKMTR